MTPVQRLYWGVVSLGNLMALASWHFWPGGWSALFCSLTLTYSIVGAYDLFFSPHTLNRLYPVLAYIRYFIESYRIEIQQYLIANNTEEQPFNREQRSLVYQRSKGISDTLPFGTQRDLMQPNYLSIWHSTQPTQVKESAKRVLFGGPLCRRPYAASLLNISALSFGALSSHAIEALNLGAKLGGFFQNTGEGGVSPYHLKHGGDLVWQLGTGLFGCRDKNGRFDPEAFEKVATKSAIKMIEVKLSQGAKPGHGGILPKGKITDELAAIRGVDKTQDCISPAMNPECNTPIALMQFIAKLRELSQGKPVGFKLCIGNPAEFISLCKAMLETEILPDFITVDGAEGGTGAAPVEFSNRLGMMCLESTYLVHNALVGVGLRDKIRIISAGKTASSFDILAKIALGADSVNAARTMMMAVGCIQSRQCNTNHCPTGIATQDPTRARAIDIDTKGQRVWHFQNNTLHNFYELLGSMGLDDPAKLTANMLKRRTANGLLESSVNLVPPLQVGELLNKRATETWRSWWRLASSQVFYVGDETPIRSPELFVRNI